MTDALLEDPMYDTALAIVGMAGRFPGASDLETFWQNIAGGVTSIQEFSEEELVAAGCDARLVQHPHYVKAGTVLQDIECFDASFFGFAPKEALYMDPQHRLFLECAWEALEQAGYIPGQTRGLVGVFAGSRPSDYVWRNLLPRKDMLESVSQLLVSINNDCDSLASQVSYKLNLKGPSASVQTYCSSSLVATHLACQSLLTYECDLALAGGVALTLPQPGGYLYEEGGILSPDGRCCTFDGNSKGSVIGNGLGIVVLKRFKEALEDGDMIYAVIRGSAVNNDGGVRAGYTAPGLEGQSAVIAEALTRSGVSFESLAYIEAHGTGTPLGDTIELAALIKAFASQTQKRQFCALGSVKPNIGHLDRAAGVTGLIKTALALHHQYLPPSLNFERTGSDINLQQTPFYINTSLREWKSDGETPRRAGVNSFGLGGTNAHVVLEEAPARFPGSQECSWYLLPLAARSNNALQKMAWRLADHLESHPGISLADVAYTLQVGRSPFQQRRTVVCQNTAQAIKFLRANEEDHIQLDNRQTRAARLFSDYMQLFPDNIAVALLEQEETLHNAVKQCIDIIETRFQGNRVKGKDEQTYKGLLEILGWLWEQGEEVDWQRLARQEKHFRVPLPTYPFERERFWVEPGVVQQTLTQAPAQPEISLSPLEAVMSEEPERESEIANWFSRLSWKQTSTRIPFPTDQSFCWLLFLDACGVGLRTREELLKHQQTVIMLRPGTEFAYLGEQQYSVRPAVQADFATLLKILRDRGELPQKVAHFWMVTPDESQLLSEEALTGAFEYGFASLLAFVQALSDLSLAACDITIISSGIQDVLGSEKLSPQKALILGPCNVIGQEYAQISCKSVDVLLPSPGSREEDLFIEALSGELTNPSEERIVALRNQYRWVRTVEAVRLEKKASTSSAWREGGVYLIAGGLGGIGLALADYLVKTMRARVIITSRSGLPPRASWSTLLEEHGDAQGIGYRIRQVQALEATVEEGQVQVLQADVTNETQMRAVVDQIMATFGALHGVLHVAALPPSGLIQLKTPEMALQVMRPKLWGTLVLERATEHLPLDFLVLFSSISAVVGGGPGQVDYSAANAFLDAYAHTRRKEQRKTITLGWGEWLWDAWAEGLEGFPLEARTYFQMKRKKFGISFADGMEALTQALTRGIPHLMITTQNFAQLLEGSRHFSIATIIDRLQQMRKSQPPAARPALDVPYVAPQTVVEKKIAAIWSELLGIEQVGVDDDFFQLGGHSLIGTQLVLSLRKAFQVDLPVVVIFEASTVATLAQEIELLLLDEIEKMSAEEVEGFVIAENR